MDRATERALIRRAAAGDRAAAGECVRAHQRYLYVYMLRMCGRPELAEDLVQETFVRALTNLDRFDDRYRFSTWLFVIARRLYINALQKRSPIFAESFVTEAGASNHSPDAGLIGAEVQANARTALEAALQGLPEHQREVVVLFHQFEWPIAQIARHMEMPVGTVKSHLHRGRRRLRESLEASGTAAARVEEVWG
jgi:RNA polymerase sigma-70 factor, ECF subfamily